MVLVMRQLARLVEAVNDGVTSSSRCEETNTPVDTSSPHTMSPTNPRLYSHVNVPIDADG